MKSLRLTSCCALRCSATFWLLLLVTAAAQEVYDEAPSGDEDADMAYQDNDVDTGPESRQRSSYLEPSQDVMQKLLKAFHTRDEPSYRPSWRPEGTTHSIQQIPGAESRVVKRLSNLLTGEKGMGFKSMEPMLRPQRKWKIKKGKAIGSQMVCYFKLCAFRSPI